MIRQKDFTYDNVNFKGLPEFVRDIKKDGLRYIIILVSVTMKRDQFIQIQIAAEFIQVREMVRASVCA